MRNYHAAADQPSPQAAAPLMNLIVDELGSRWAALKVLQGCAGQPFAGHLLVEPEPSILLVIFEGRLSSEACWWSWRGLHGAVPLE